MALEHALGWDPCFVERHPLMWPLARAAEPVRACTAWPTLAQLDALYAVQAQRRGAPLLRFAPYVRRRRSRKSAPIALAELYDGRIALRGEVPTREQSWHDLLNALCFATWPKSKHALHLRQCRAQAARLQGGATRLPPARTAEQDALTLLDEGGVVIAALPDAATELATTPTRDLPTRLGDLQGSGRARAVPFGHALFEHLVEGLPCPGTAARILVFEALPRDTDTLLDAIDDSLALTVEDPSCFGSHDQTLHLRLGLLASTPGSAHP